MELALEVVKAIAVVHVLIAVKTHVKVHAKVVVAVDVPA